MPRPEEKPPSKRVDELVTEIGIYYWSEEKYGSYPTATFDDRHKRDTDMIAELIRELAIERAENEILKGK